MAVQGAGLGTGQVSGRPMIDKGRYMTCPNGGWWQEQFFVLWDELTVRYAVDGLFFNAWGHKEATREGEYFGPCHCTVCTGRFAERFGQPRRLGSGVLAEPAVPAGDPGRPGTARLPLREVAQPRGGALRRGRVDGRHRKHSIDAGGGGRDGTAASIYLGNGRRSRTPRRPSRADPAAD